MKAILIGSYQEDIPGLNIINRQDVKIASEEKVIEKQVYRICEEALNWDADVILFDKLPPRLLAVLCRCIMRNLFKELDLGVGYLAMRVPEEKQNPKRVNSYKEISKFSSKMGQIEIAEDEIIREGYLPLEFDHIEWIKTVY